MGTNIAILENVETDSVASKDNTAMIDDDDDEQEIALPSAPPLIEEDEGDNEELQKQLMHAAFVKFKQKKEQKEEEDVMTPRDEEEEENQISIEETEDDEEVTPPLDDDIFMITPSPFYNAKTSNAANDGNSKPIIASKAYHGYQPSWASSDHKINIVTNQFSYFAQYEQQTFAFDDDDANADSDD